LSIYKQNDDDSLGYSVVSERLAVIESMVHDIHGRLFGNGQPGELEKLKARVGVLERIGWMTAGACTTVGIIWAAVTQLAPLLAGK
jgi:hypothetical protein